MMFVAGLMLGCTGNEGKNYQIPEVSGQSQAEAERLARLQLQECNLKVRAAYGHSDLGFLSFQSETEKCMKNHGYGIS